MRTPHHSVAIVEYTAADEHSQWPHRRSLDVPRPPATNAPPSSSVTPAGTIASARFWVVRSLAASDTIASKMSSATCHSTRDPNSRNAAEK